jgi:PAS domain S-box-containing protein
MGYLWISDLLQQFNSDALKIQTEYYNSQKLLIKNSVDEAIFDMDFAQNIILSDSSKSSLAPRLAMVNKLKKEILIRLSKMRFGKEGYMFVNTMDNQALIYDAKIQEKPRAILKSGKPDWIKLYLRMKDSVSDGNGHYLEYPFKMHSNNTNGYKISFVRIYKPWGWIIGSGVYYDELNKTANIERNKLRDRIENDIFRLVIISLFAIFFMLFIINKLIKRSVSQNIIAFKKVFSKSADDFTLVNTEKINYEEFRELASSANKMIKERNHFFDALSQEQILLRSLIDAVPNLIFYKNRDSVYIGCNHAFADYMGHKESEIIGHTDIDLLGEERAGAYHESDRKLLETKKLIINEELITYPDGRQLRYETIKTTFNDVNGNVQGIIGISFDITARYAMEEQLKIAKEKAEESNRLKTAFLANMSHEIRTPLNAIIGFSNLLVYDDLETEDKEVYSRLITQSGDSLANLINDIVDMAKIESGQVDVEKNEFKVNELMSDLLVIYRERIIQMESAVSVIYDPDPLFLELDLNSDRFRIDQVLVNLINNALKFSEQGEITFGYRVKDDYCYFFVKDQGIGILEENLKKIFEVFTQVDGTYSRQYGGVGLGLSISKRLITLMNGEIWVESQHGVGSTFTFSIPLK